MDYKRYGGNADLYANSDENCRLKVVMEGDYRGRHFVIGAHNGGHPNAYIEVKDVDAVNQEAKEYDDFDGGLSRVNGGSTYFGRAYWDEKDSRTYVGWDYAHAYDYHPKYTPEGTKWNIVDILMEISSAESELENLNEDDPEYYNRLYGHLVKE